MKMPKIKTAAKKLMIDRKSHLERETGAVYYHGQRTANLVLELRKIILPADDSQDQILTAAAWLHDCGKGLEPHAKYGAIIARQAIEGLCTPQELDEICALIALHCQRSPKSNIHNTSTRLLQDADLLDHYGVNEIWMGIQYYAHTGGSINDLIGFYSKHYLEQTEKARAQINFEASLHIFDEKCEYIRSYIDRLAIEGQGYIYHFTQEEDEKDG